MSSKATAALRAGLALVAVLVAAWVVATQWRVESSLLSLLPQDADSAAHRALRGFGARFNATMVLSFGPSRPSGLNGADAAGAGGSSETRVNEAEVPTSHSEPAAVSSQQLSEIAERLAAKLRADPAVAAVQLGPPEGVEEALYQLYFPRRLLFLESDPERLEQALSSEDIQRRVEGLRQILASPTAALVRPIAAQDPWLAFYDHMQGLNASRPKQLELLDGRYRSSDGYAILFVELRQQFLGVEEQALFLSRLARHVADAKGVARGLRFERSGANLFSVDIAGKIQRDIQRIAVVSLLAVLLLMMTLFRSGRSTVLALLVPGLSILFGVATVLLSFGEIHAMTFAFAAAFIGVGVDYPIHLLCHWRDAGPAQLAVARVRRPMTVSALTTVVGIAALGLTSMPVLQQAAVASAAGILAALLLTLLVVPFLASGRGSALRARAARHLQGACSALARQRASLVLPITLAAVAGVGLSSARWSGSLDDLVQRDPTLQSEVERVQARVGAPSSQHLVLVRASTDEQALRLNDAVALKLKSLQAEGKVQNYHTLHSLLWSAQQQRANWERTQRKGVWEDTARALQQSGFRLEAMQGFRQMLAAPERPPELRLEELEVGPTAELVRPYVLRENGEVLLATYLRGVTDVDAVARTFEGTAGVTVLHQKAVLMTAYRWLRDRVRWLLVVAAGVMVLSLLLHLRRLPLAAAAVLPALLAPSGALGILACMGQELNLFHLLASIVVMAMAMDFGVFMVELRRAPELQSTGIAQACLSVSVAALTSSLSFGLLGFSTVPVLVSIGSTVALGMFLALLLLPTTLRLGGSLPEWKAQ